MMQNWRSMAGWILALLLLSPQAGYAQRFSKSVTIEGIDGTVAAVDAVEGDDRYFFYVTDQGEVGAIDLWQRRVATVANIGASNPKDFAVVRFAPSESVIRLKSYFVDGSSTLRSIGFDPSTRTFAVANSITLASAGSASMLAKSTDHRYIFVHSATDASLFVVNTQTTTDTESNLIDFSPSEGAEEDPADPFTVGQTPVDIVAAPAAEGGYHLFLLSQGTVQSESILNVYGVNPTTPQADQIATIPSDLSDALGVYPGRLAVSENGQRVYVFNERKESEGESRGGSIALLSGASPFSITATLAVEDLADGLEQFLPDALTLSGVFAQQDTNSTETLFLAGTFQALGVSTQGIAVIPSSFVVSQSGDPELIDISSLASPSNDPVVAAGNGFLATVAGGRILMRTENPIVTITKELTKTSFTTADPETGILGFSSDEDGTYTIRVQRIGATSSATVASGNVTAGEEVSFELKAEHFTAGEGSYELVIAVTDGDGNTGRMVTQARKDDCPGEVPDAVALPGDRNVTIIWNTLTAADIAEYRLFFKAGSITREEVLTTTEEERGDCVTINDLIAGFNVSSLGEDQNAVTVGDITMVIVEQPSQDSGTTTTTSSSSSSSSGTSGTSDTQAFAQEEVDLGGGETTQDTIASVQLSVKIKGLVNGTPYSAFVLGVDEGGKLSGSARILSATPARTFGAAELSGDGGCGVTGGRGGGSLLLLLLSFPLLFARRRFLLIPLLLLALTGRSAAHEVPPFPSTSEEASDTPDTMGGETSPAEGEGTLATRSHAAPTSPPRLEKNGTTGEESSGETLGKPRPALHIEKDAGAKEGIVGESPQESRLALREAPEASLEFEARPQGEEVSRFTFDLIEVGWYFPTNRNVRDVYGRKWLERYMLGLGYRLTSALTIDFGTGFFKEGGTALTETRGESGDATDLILVPLRLDLSWQYLRHPDAWFVPFVGAGLDGYVWIERREPDQRLNGFNYGLHGRAGMKFLLDPLGRSSANRLRKSWGIEHTYLTLQAEYGQLDDFGQNGLDLSGLFSSVGIQFSF